MLLAISHVLAGAYVYENVFCDKPSEASKEDNESESAVQLGEVSKAVSTAIYRVKSGNGELSLPPCKLMGVELGPSTNTNKATLRVMVDKSVEKEHKPVTDIGKEKKYVKLTPTQYHVNIILRTKEKSVVPITAYYRT